MIGLKEGGGGEKGKERRCEGDTAELGRV